jgi:dCMP deaminase
MENLRPPGKPAWKQDVFLNMAFSISRLSKDPDTQHGAVLVDKKNIIISTGYNGPPAAIPDHLIDWARPTKYPFIIHAEENAIHFGVAARGLHGLEGSSLYVTGRPCAPCMLRAVRARIGKVVFGPRSWSGDTPENRKLVERIAKLGYVELIDFTFFKEI